MDHLSLSTQQIYDPFHVRESNVENGSHEAALGGLGHEAHRLGA